eukprot:scaffold125124_cov47-Attheya_sp.AAC.1
MVRKNIICAIVATIAVTDMSLATVSASQPMAEASPQRQGAMGRTEKQRYADFQVPTTDKINGHVENVLGATSTPSQKIDKKIGEQHENPEKMDNDVPIPNSSSLRGQASFQEAVVEESMHRHRKLTAREENVMQRKTDRMRRNREQHERVKAQMKKTSPNPSTLTRMSTEELDAAKEKFDKDPDDILNQWVRRAWGSSKLSYSPYSLNMASPGTEYDMWQQAYRMLGGYIDCDHAKDGSGDNKDDGGDGSCSRWMIWASYIDPNYGGGGYDEYYGDDAEGVLDCHKLDTDWQLLGVYRQEFYQYLEQISKHLWAIDDYEYVVALAGLSFITDEDCWAVADDVYAGVEMLQGGKFQMSLYQDTDCKYPVTDLGYSIDDLGLTSDLQLAGSGSGDDDNNDAYAYAEEWWEDTQEETLEMFNDVYEDYKYCTSCIDYPTYQDGFFIGEDGTDEDDLINQCWKFYSHDSFVCESNCIALAHEQGSITAINYGGKTFGVDTLTGYGSTTSTSSSYTSNKSSVAYSPSASKMSKLKANLFMTFSGIVFIATFLAFAVARGNGKKERSRSSRTKRLLPSRSKDGSRSRKMRSKSRSRRDGGQSRSKSRGGEKSASRSKSRPRDSTGEYEPPAADSRPPRRGKSKSRSKPTEVI